MSESPDVKVKSSDTYKEINVTGQLTNISYGGIKLTVLNDVLDLAPALTGDKIKMSKATITREIQCTINLTPINLKTWVRLLSMELKRYENLFGTILSPEEIAEKFKNSAKKE